MNQNKTGARFQVVKDELPDGRGYRLTFVELPPEEPKQQLLPLNPSDPGYLAMIAGITKKHIEPEGPKEPMFVYASDQGIGLIEAMGADWVVGNLLKADATAEASLEERMILDAKPCVITRLPKVTDTQGTARLLQKESEVQDYLKRFGITTRVSEALYKVSTLLKTCKLEPSLEEYIAGKEVMVCEYRAGERLGDIKRAVEALAHDQDPGSFGMTKRQWLYWFDQFEAEVTYLRELFFMVGYEKGEPYTQADLGLDHWLCSGVDAKAGKPELTLIDQRPTSLGSPDSVLDTDDMARSVRYRELMARYRDDGVLVRLRA